MVDTLRLILAVAVHAVDVQDRDDAKQLVTKLVGQFPRLALIWADGGYAGQVVEWTACEGGWVLEFVKRPPDNHGLRGVAPPVGRGADVRRAGAVPPAEQGL